VEPEGFARKVAQAKARPKSTVITWKDPVHDLHMRTKSDIVMICSEILMYEDNVTIWQSNGTEDYLTPDIVNRGCLLSVRTRESGGIMYLDKAAVIKSGLEDHPAL
jgi:hypothetical protein